MNEHVEKNEPPINHRWTTEPGPNGTTTHRLYVSLLGLHVRSAGLASNDKRTEEIWLPILQGAIRHIAVNRQITWDGVYQLDFNLWQVAGLL